jgi:hypothetical protein
MKMESDVTDITTIMSTAKTTTLVTVPAVLDEKMKEAKSIGVHHWKIDQPLFFKNMKMWIFMIDLTNAYLKACSEDEAKALAAKTHCLRGKTWYENKDSHVRLHCLEISGFNDPNYIKLISQPMKDYVPFIVYFGPFCHIFGFLREMLAARKVIDVIVLPHLEVDPVTGPYFVDGYVESGPYLFARDQYPGETEEQIAAYAADGVYIMRSKPTTQ